MHLAENSAILLEAWWENLLTYHLCFNLGNLRSLFEHFIDLIVTMSSEENFECHLSHHKGVNQLLLCEPLNPMFVLQRTLYFKWWCS